MTLRQHIDKFLNKYLPHTVVAAKPMPLTKKKIDYMPSEIYKAKLMTDPKFKSEAEAVLSTSRVRYYSSDSQETKEMVIDPKVVVRGFGRG